MAKIYEGNQPFVFISYSHKDTPYVMEVVRALDESGIRVWYDGGIEAGSEWPEYIANHLTTCGCVLCFVSKNYADSDNCRRELTFSLNLKKPTLSLYMEQFEMSPGLQMQLGLVQAVFCDRFATAEALVQEISSVPMVAACRATDDDDESFVQSTAPVVTPTPVASNPSVDAYLKRVFMFLEDGEWSSAAEYCEKVLDVDPECAEAYLGKLMAQLKVNEREQLQNCAKSFDDNNNYKKILRFGDETLKAEVVGYNDGIRARLEAGRIAKEKREEEARIAREKREEEARIAQEKKAEERRVANAKRAEAKRKREEEERIAREKEAEEERQRVKENTRRLCAIREKIRPAQHMIGTGFNHIVGVKADGTMLAVGSPYEKPPNDPCVVDSFLGVIATSAGSHVTGILGHRGYVKVVGRDILGQYNTSDWSNIVAISMAVDRVVGLKADGTVVAVGDNDYGQCDVSGWTDIVAISAGDSHTVGLKADGTVVAIGRDHEGECKAKKWKDMLVVSAGDYYTVGLKANGKVIAVGNHTYKQTEVTGWTDIKKP